MERTAIILSGGHSKRFGRDKCMIELVGKPLIFYVFERIFDIVEEVIVVVDSVSLMDLYSQIFLGKVKIVIDEMECQSPLVGALTGFMNSNSEYSILLPCDTPFASKDFINLLFDLSSGFDAVIPRWPNGYIEPLQAVYKTRAALTAARRAFRRNEMKMSSMISLLRKVRYIPTLAVKKIDPELNTFFNINTLADLKTAEKLLKKGTEQK